MDLRRLRIAGSRLLRCRSRVVLLVKTLVGRMERVRVDRQATRRNTDLLVLAWNSTCLHGRRLRHGIHARRLRLSLSLARRHSRSRRLARRRRGLLLRA